MDIVKAEFNRNYIMSTTPWYLKSVKNILIDHMGIETPSFELLKWVQSAIENARDYWVDHGQDLEALAKVKSWQQKHYNFCESIDYSQYCRIKKYYSGSIDIWNFIYGFDESQIMFLTNNFADKLKFEDKYFYIEFFRKTKDFPNAKEIALKYLEINDLDKAIELCKKEDFDLTLLDFLEGKVHGEKMINWAVGQVMKEYPKRFAPAEVKEAVMKRFMI